MRWLLGGWCALCFGCVGGDVTADASAPGALGGPCYANNTCNAGLVCVLEAGKGVCETPDATVDAPADVSGDTASNDAGDAGCVPTSPPGLACTPGCDGGVCCAQMKSCALLAAACVGVAWSCQTAYDCTGNAYCCASGFALQPGCPPTANLGPGSQTTCRTTCQTGEMALCLSKADCPAPLGGIPSCVSVDIPQLAISIGACQ